MRHYNVIILMFFMFMPSVSYANDNNYIIETVEGKPLLLERIELRYYYRKSEYWHSKSKNYYLHSSSQNYIRIIQGWLWSDIDISNIKKIERVYRFELPRINKKIKQEWPTIYKGMFTMDLYKPIFKITFIDGSSTYANIDGKILGTKIDGSLSIDFSTKTSNISEAVVRSFGNTRSALDFVFTSGEKQKNVIKIQSAFHSDWNRNNFEIYDYLRSVVEFSGEHGGITIDLKAKNFGDRIISIKKRTKSNHFEMFGLSSNPIKTLLAWIRASQETYTSDLRFIKAKTLLKGIPSYIIVSPELIKVLTLKKSNSKSLVASLVINHGQGDILIKSLSDISYWYNDAISHFNVSEKRRSIKISVGKVQLDVILNDIAEYYTDEKGNTTIITKNGENHSGKITETDGKTYAIVGTLSGNGYYGFPGEVCFLLNQIRSFKIQTRISRMIHHEQNKFHDLGYYPGPTDGILGNKTIRALSAFQKNNKLTKTGKLDNLTTQKLGLQ